MKSSFLLLLVSHFLLFGSFLSRAQDPKKKDSIVSALRSAGQDTVRIGHYNTLANLYMRGNAQTVIAKKYADSALRLADILGHSRGKAISHFRYGNIYKAEGSYQQAIRHIDSGLIYFERMGDSSAVADGLYVLASVQRNLGNLDKSLDYYYRVLKISEWEKNPISIASTLNSIGIIFRNLKQYDNAITYYNKSLRILDSLGNKRRTATCLNALGGIYGEKGDYEQAESYFLRSLDINTELNNKRAMAYNLSNLGHLNIDLKNYSRALEFHEKALAIREQLGRKRGLILSLMSLGEIHLLLGHYQKSKNHLDPALVLAKEIKSAPLIRDSYKLLGDLSNSKKDFQNAYAYQTLYTLFKDSVLNEESHRQINEMQAKYETEKKDQQIVILAKEKEVQEKEIQRQATLKNAFILGVILLALLGGSFLYSFRLRTQNQRAIDSKNQEIKEVNFKRQLTELEMKALQAQINPHFIFNCMSSINDLILEGDTKNASIYLTKFSKLMRLVLENSEETEISLKNELDLLRAYVQLEALRFNGNISCDFQVDNAIDLEDTYLPGMVLQPFIENAIWHGLQHKQSKNNGKITIEVEQHQDLLFCAVEDNGVGREKASQLQQNSVWKRKSLGISITEERLKLLNKKLQKQLIHIKDLKDKTGNALGTRVEVHIPFT